MNILRYIFGGENLNRNLIRHLILLFLNIEAPGASNWGNMVFYAPYLELCYLTFCILNHSIYAYLNEITFEKLL